MLTSNQSNYLRRPEYVPILSRSESIEGKTQRSSHQLQRAVVRDASTNTFKPADYRISKRYSNTTIHLIRCQARFPNDSISKEMKRVMPIGLHVSAP